MGLAENRRHLAKIVFGEGEKQKSICCLLGYLVRFVYISDISFCVQTICLTSITRDIICVTNCVDQFLHYPPYVCLVDALTV